MLGLEQGGSGYPTRPQRRPRSAGHARKAQQIVAKGAEVVFDLRRGSALAHCTSAGSGRRAGPRWSRSVFQGVRELAPTDFAAARADVCASGSARAHLKLHDARPARSAIRASP